MLVESAAEKVQEYLKSKSYKDRLEIVKQQLSDPTSSIDDTLRMIEMEAITCFMAGFCEGAEGITELIQKTETILKSQEDRIKNT